jgi:SAM-dependent methyltransferase
MAKAYIPSVFLQSNGSQLYAIFGWSQRKPEMVLSRSWLSLLEIFVHEHSVESAYIIYQKIKNLSVSTSVITTIDRYKRNLHKSDDELIVYLGDQKVTLLGNGLRSIVDQELEINLSELSRETYQVLTYLFSTKSFPKSQDSLDNLEEFAQVVNQLADLGILSPAIGMIDWGDFKRTVPICHACGFTRKTPIDRYYLSKFVQEIQEEVVGSVLEIGAVPKDKDFYNFSKRPIYKVLNLEDTLGVDIAGDVHNPTLVEPESFDSIIIFNVLEHCHSPWKVVENIHRWLKVGGKCFCLVPNAQRLHDRPADYWRPLPDGLSRLFENFSKQKLSVYGNPLSVIAIFHGIAAEELESEELEAFHPDYPVISCIVAEK